ncbi:MAG: metallophosphoesterase [Bacteroidia bacterium]|nr:metallophosphoesterase [Bacteroidia bacterium]
MKILHLTDFHYSNDKKHEHDQNKIIDALVVDLKSETQIDYLFFTGDLVFSGKKYEDFITAKELLINRLEKELKLKKQNIFICPGNHDIYRDQELEDTTDKIKQIDNSEKLEEFLKRQEGKSFKESLKNTLNYNKFQEEFYNEFSGSEKQLISDLYTIRKTNYHNHKIGILTINSAWRAIDSKTDRGNLLFPISLLKAAIEETKKNTDFRIILLHHPISDFKDWNGSEMEDLIHKEFHLLFSGHLHKKKQTIQICTDEGIFCCSSAATLALDGTTNGYTIIEIDVETYDIEINNRFYNRQDGVFLHPKESIKTSIPVGDQKKAANDFKKTLRKKYQEELMRANELFISYDSKEGSRGFIELFTDPILKNKTRAQIAENKSDTGNITISSFISSKENILLFGKDKSGKTSILYKIFLDLLADFTLHKTIPILIDAKEYKSSKKTLELYKNISLYYEMSAAKAKSLSSTYSIRLLIDNYDPNFSSFNEVINTFLEENETVTFIAATEEKLAASFTSYVFDGRTYSNLYIHEISRPEVRLLANKWPGLTTDKKEIILEKIFGIFTQLNIPTNYWTVSLFLWIFEKNNDANFHNSFELIQLYIDNLLDRKRLALDKSSKINFDDFKAYLAQLAHFLLFERIDKGYTATYAEIVEFTSFYRDKNKRFVIEVKDVIDLVIEKNILRKAFDDSYTFRLNGVFEYFVALYMTHDKEFCDKIINDDHYYLSFKNELELFAGFEKNNSEYLDKIYKRTKSIFRNVEEKYSKTSIDKQLMLKISEAYDISLPVQQLSSEIKKTFTVEKQDEMLAEMNPVNIQKSEVKVKHYYEKIEDNSNNLEKALHILARVFRNSNIQDEKQVSEVFDYILNNACYMGFKLIDEAEEDGVIPNSEALSEQQEQMLVQLITNFMPIIVQTFFYDAIAQNDLERILKDKIQVLKKDAKNNQFQLLILYFTLIDLDLNAHKDLIDEVIELINLNTLRQTTLLKLFYYLMFKCNNKPLLEELLKNKIRIQTLKINPKTDVGELQKGILKTTNLVKLKNVNNKRK